MPGLKYNIDEVFGIMIPDEEEVEVGRTPDFGSLSKGPNWNDQTKVFQLGMHNAENSILSNMISSKMKKNAPSLYDFLDAIQSQQRLWMELITNIIDKILEKL
jgi:hypothetical protein